MRSTIISAPNDFRDIARRRLPRFLFDYADGGAFDEVTLRRNVQDLARISLRQRVLTGCSEIDLRTNLLGQEVKLPVVLGPVGIAGMYRRRGEIQAAAAARAAGIPFCLSTVGLCSLPEVAGAVGSDSLWFQLYVLRDRAFMRELLKVAQEVGVRTLLFTVDMPLPAVRYRDARSGMSGPRARWRRMCQAVSRPGWAWDVGVRGRPHLLGNLAAVLGKGSGLEDYMGWLNANFDPSIVWRDLEWIRAAWPGALVIKGILDPADAREAAAIGAQGIVVSNHGGRQLDGALSSARALPRIMDTVGGQLTVLADGGVRSGLDVVRMLALGAQGVLMGRAWVYALAAQGNAGVTTLLRMLAQEMRVAMTLTGTRRIQDIDRAILDPEAGRE